MDENTFRLAESMVTALVGGGAVLIGRFVLNYLKEKNALDIDKDTASLTRLERVQAERRRDADYVITHFERIMADKDREHTADAEQWQREKSAILTELRRTRDSHQINLATLEGMRIRLADRDRLVSELRGGVHPMSATPDRTDSVIITDDTGVIYYINQNVTLLTKWSDVDIIDQNISVLFPDDAQRDGETLAAWLRPGGTRDRLIKARLRQRDGVLIPVDMLVSVFEIRSVGVARFQIRQTFESQNVDLNLDIYVPPNPSASTIRRVIPDAPQGPA